MKTLLIMLAVLAPLWVFSQNDTPKPAPPATETPATENAQRYSMVVEINPATLVTRVNEAMKIGWEPAGGIAATVTGNSSVQYFQAMVKRPVRGVVPPAK